MCSWMNEGVKMWQSEWVDGWISEWICGKHVSECVREGVDESVVTVSSGVND